MPIYEYCCSKCGHDFEELVQSSTVEKVPCPKCKSTATEKRLSVFAPRATEAAAIAPGGCGRCGDPNGPCQA